MEDAPDVDAVGLFEVEDQVRKARQWPEAQPRQVEFMGTARGARAGVPGDVDVGCFELVDAGAERPPWSSLPRRWSLSWSFRMSSRTYSLLVP